MNRLHPTAAEPSMEAGVVVTGRVRLGNSVSAEAPAECSLALFGPLHYEPGYAYPLIVWLHGPGDDELQLQRIMPHVSMRNFVAVAPRGARRMTAECQSGYTWPLGREGAVAVQERVAGAIAAAMQRYHVHPDRVFVAGFGAGGTLALRLAMEGPECFAGAISLCGGFPRRDAPLARLAASRRVPLFIACGRDSRAYSPRQVCCDLRLLHAAGLEVTLRQYAGGQEVSLPMLADVNRWIMERIGCV